MVIDHQISNTEFKASINYNLWFHKTWLEIDSIKELLSSEYMDNLMHYVFQTYDKGVTTYPLKRNLFKSFEHIDFDDLKVVIINECPAPTFKTNGNGFGEYADKDNDISTFNPTLRDIERCVTKGYPENGVVKFDRTLRDWNYQGVLVLNTSLINHPSTKESIADNADRQLYFRNFTREIIKTINNESSDVIFVFTDDSQEEIFGKYIDKDFHYTLKTDGFTPDSTIFDDINQLLLENAKNVTNWDEVMINW